MCERDKERSGATDGGEGASNNTDEHDEREVACRLSTKEYEREESERYGERRVDRASHRFINRLPYCIFK